MLTEKEIEILFEALSLWEKDPVSGNLGIGLISAMLMSKADDESKAEIEKAENQRKEAQRIEAKERERFAIQLKSKLLSLPSIN